MKRTLMGAVLLSALFTSCGYSEGESSGYQKGVREIRTEAAVRGYGVWIVDRTSGFVLFQWKDVEPK